MFGALRCPQANPEKHVCGRSHVAGRPIVPSIRRFRIAVDAADACSTGKTMKNILPIDLRSI